MALILDRNANTLAHDYATPPYRLTAVYIAYATGHTGATLKVGATQVQSKDLVSSIMSKVFMGFLVGLMS